MKNSAFIYDKVPYPSFTFPQTNPRQLAVMGKFYGMKPAQPSKSRVLELGCGDGANLVSLAFMLPGSKFVGVDLSAQHIRDAKRSVRELKLKNIDFYQSDVTKFSKDEFGEFDYIIAHGLFSWVPDFVRSSILKIYSECLSPQGIGYISYNAYPGCRIREMLWGMMQYHVEGTKDPMTKVSRGLDFLARLVDSAESDTVYQNLLQLELEAMAKRSPENIFHDDLTNVNQPFYFHEFVDMIKPFKLQFLSEAEAHLMSEANLTAKEQENLRVLGGDFLRHEQYMDFIKWRRFRTTLVCRDDVRLRRTPKPKIVKNFMIFSGVTPASDEPKIATTDAEQFIGPHGAKLEVNHPLTKAALVVLKRSFPLGVEFKELVSRSREMIDDPDSSADAENIDRLAGYMFELFKAGYIKLLVEQPAISPTAGEFPRASEFALWQINQGSDYVTTLSGLNLGFDREHVKELLSLLDGTRDRPTLFKEMVSRFEIPEADREGFERELPGVIDANLAELAEAGLLTA